jgi:thiamine biosynthesis protein ThiS
LRFSARFCTLCAAWADSIEIIINGETQAFDGAVSVADLLARLGLPEKKIAVEHNLEIVPKSAYASHMVEAGDRIEIVHFIGGG